MAPLPTQIYILKWPTEPKIKRMHERTSKWQRSFQFKAVGVWINKTLLMCICVPLIGVQCSGECHVCNDGDTDTFEFMLTVVFLHHDVCLASVSLLIASFRFSVTQCFKPISNSLFYLHLHSNDLTVGWLNVIESVGFFSSLWMISLIFFLGTNNFFSHSFAPVL